MKVRFLKNHVNWKTGDIANIDDSMAAYMLLCGVVEHAEVDIKKQEDILLQHLEKNKPDKNIKSPPPPVKTATAKKPKTKVKA